METLNYFVPAARSTHKPGWSRDFLAKPYFMKNTCLNVIKGLIIIGLLVFSLSLNAQYYPDKGDWQHKTPAEYGINAARITEAVDFANANEYT
ncbi:MAG: hypothetical protein IH592_06865, partial [Bacteroidales bacterium]|nr:hypothetical protein [Bacteroidales bacterium]